MKKYPEPDRSVPLKKYIANLMADAILRKREAEYLKEMEAGNTPPAPENNKNKRKP